MSSTLGRRAQEFACAHIARFARGGYLRTELGDVLEEFARLEAEQGTAPALRQALEAIIDEAPGKPIGDKPTVGFQPSSDPEQDDGNEVVEEAFQEGVTRGLWLAAEIASAALSTPPAKETGR